MLIINQGTQKIQDDVKIVENDVTLQVIKVQIHPSLSGALKVTFKIIKGKNAGKVVSDAIFYTPDNTMSWKYTHLRKCLGVPYKQGEDPNLDIESLMMNKCCMADLSERLDSKNRSWQNIKYKPMPAITQNAPAPAPTSATGTAPATNPTLTISNDAADWGVETKDEQHEQTEDAANDDMPF